MRPENVKNKIQELTTTTATIYVSNLSKKCISILPPVKRVGFINRWEVSCAALGILSHHESVLLTNFNKTKNTAFFI